MFSLAQLPIEELTAQIKNGLVLMVLGMAIVFIFLTILVFVTKGVSKVVRKMESKKPVEVKAPQVEVAAPAASCEADIAVAIAAAFAKSRN